MAVFQRPPARNLWQIGGVVIELKIPADDRCSFSPRRVFAQLAWNEWSEPDVVRSPSQGRVPARIRGGAHARRGRRRNRIMQSRRLWGGRKRGRYEPRGSQQREITPPFAKPMLGAVFFSSLSISLSALLSYLSIRY